MDTTVYYRYPDGSYSAMTVTGPEGTAPVPDGATVITEEEYNAGVAAVEEANQAYIDHLAAEDEARKRDSYEDLIAAGIPDATARALSGYQGPGPEQS